MRHDEEEDSCDGEGQSGNDRPQLVKPRGQELSCHHPDTGDEDEKERDLCDADTRVVTDGQEEGHGSYFRRAFYLFATTFEDGRTLIASSGGCFALDEPNQLSLSLSLSLSTNL
jgi:hypothetical protein